MPTQSRRFTQQAPMCRKLEGIGAVWVVRTVQGRGYQVTISLEDPDPRRQSPGSARHCPGSARVEPLTGGHAYRWARPR